MPITGIQNNKLDDNFLGKNAASNIKKGKILCKIFILNILINVVQIRIRIWIRSLSRNYTEAGSGKNDPQHCFSGSRSPPKAQGSGSELRGT